MHINTKYFGTVSYNKDEIVHFPEGLFGFEDYKNYLPLAFQSKDDAMISLQSMDDEHLAFILMNPFYLMEDYKPTLQNSDLVALNSPNEEDLSYYVVCVIKEDAEKSTVNLKCPIIVNTAIRCARQIILDSSHYTFRHILADFTKKGA
jgi:flagellar assembly factor FliW